MKKLLSIVAALILSASMWAVEIPWILINDTTDPNVKMISECQVREDVIKYCESESYWVFSYGDREDYYKIAKAVWDNDAQQWAAQIKKEVTWDEIMVLTQSDQVYLHISTHMGEYSISQALQAEVGEYVQVEGTLTYTTDEGFTLYDGHDAIVCMVCQQYDTQVMNKYRVKAYVESNGLTNILYINKLEKIEGSEEVTPINATILSILDKPAEYVGKLVYINHCTYVGDTEEEGEVTLSQDGNEIDCWPFVTNPSKTVLYSLKAIVNYMDDEPYLLTYPEWITAEAVSALDDATMDAKTHKTLRDGKLVIRVGEREFDAQGAAL